MNEKYLYTIVIVFAIVLAGLCIKYILRPIRSKKETEKNNAWLQMHDHSKY